MPMSSQYNPFWLKKYSKVAVVGLGLTGHSVVKFLVKQPVEIFAQDTREVTDHSDAIKAMMQTNAQANDLVLGGLDQEQLCSCDLIVVSPGLSLKTPAIAAAMDLGIEVIGDIDVLVRSINLPIVAITGSNGKSTVTSLVNEICLAAGKKVFMGGNIGIPVLTILENPVSSEDYDLLVLELSSFQLENTQRLQANVAVILNISDDHMDRYDSIQDYLNAKMRIFMGARHAVINRNDGMLKGIFPTVKSITTFGIGKPENDDEYGIAVDRRGDEYFMKGSRKLMRTNGVRLVGQHNLSNILAALALLEPLSLPMDKVTAAINAFKGLEHRMEFILEHDDIRWVNDSKATNIGAARAAIEGVSGKVILLAGGLGKGADFSVLTPVLKSRVEHVVLFGEDAKKMYEVWGSEVKCVVVNTLFEAIEKAAKVALNLTGKKTVLLSPACSSFDQFASFEERGEQFAERLEQLFKKQVGAV